MSKYVSEQWNNADKETKERFIRQAAEEKRKHSELYPDYRYAPGRKEAAPQVKAAAVAAAKRPTRNRKRAPARRKVDFVTPSPTPSPDVSENEDDEDYMEDIRESKVVNGNINAPRVLPQNTVDDDVEMADVSDNLSESDELYDYESEMEEESPLYSMWTEKFTNLPRVVSAHFSFASIPTKLISSIQIPKDTDDLPQVSTTASQKSCHSMGTISPPASPKTLHNVFPPRMTSGPVSRAIRPSFREVRANLMLAPSSPTPSELNLLNGAPGWLLSTSSEPCIPEPSGFDGFEGKPIELLSDVPFDVELDMHLRDLSRDYYEWADSLH